MAPVGPLPGAVRAICSPSDRPRAAAERCLLASSRLPSLLRPPSGLVCRASLDRHLVACGRLSGLARLPLGPRLVASGHHTAAVKRLAVRRDPAPRDRRQEHRRSATRLAAKRPSSDPALRGERREFRRDARPAEWLEVGATSDAFCEVCATSSAAMLDMRVANQAQRIAHCVAARFASHHVRSIPCSPPVASGRERVQRVECAPSGG